MGYEEHSVDGERAYSSIQNSERMRKLQVCSASLDTMAFCVIHFAGRNQEAAPRSALEASHHNLHDCNYVAACRHAYDKE